VAAGIGDCVVDDIGVVKRPMSKESTGIQKLAGFELFDGELHAASASTQSTVLSG
jgi:hypothetical protein